MNRYENTIQITLLITLLFPLISVANTQYLSVHDKDHNIIIAKEIGVESDAYSNSNVNTVVIQKEEVPVIEVNNYIMNEDTALQQDDKQTINDSIMQRNAKYYYSPKKDSLYFVSDNLRASFQIKYKPETFYATNANLLNKHNKNDQIYYNRATLDMNLKVGFGKDYYKDNIANLFATIRNQANWGNPESIARTTRAHIKTLDYVDQGHQHSITRHILWLRELWLDFSIPAMLNYESEFNHTFKLGSFPFELGRGISLGSAYAVAPGFLGFFSDNTINQFAYGFKFSGNIFSSLEYDVYTAILRNQMDSFAVTSENVLGQQYGHQLKPQLGTGRLDVILAGRLRWHAVKSPTQSAVFEPYALYNTVPSQMIEFSNDASSKLYTLGLAAEGVEGNFEWGFDAARNFGHQTAKGWDRNQVTIENRLGNYTFVNSQVKTGPNGAGTNVVFTPAGNNNAQAAIETTVRSASQNGQIIAANVIDPTNPANTITIYNSNNRFRDPYKNKFQGWMTTADAGYWFCDRQLRFAAAFGYSTGDENPNKDLNNPNDSKVDSNYKGFIPLQEIYSGDRVQSVFFLGGAGRAPRPLTTPARTTSDTTPTVISGFTNLIFTGGSLLWSPSDSKRAINIRPNVLFYWQQHATKAYDIAARSVSATAYARNYLGCEFNVFFDINLMTDFKLFIVGSTFLPGAHYKDITGQPLSKEQQRILDRLDTTGFTDSSPLLSHNVSYTCNIGLEYRF